MDSSKIMESVASLPDGTQLRVYRDVASGSISVETLTSDGTVTRVDTPMPYSFKDRKDYEDRLIEAIYERTRQSVRGNSITGSSVLVRGARSVARTPRNSRKPPHQLVPPTQAPIPDQVDTGGSVRPVSDDGKIPDFMLKGLVEGEAVSVTEAVDLLQLMAQEVLDLRQGKVFVVTPEPEPSTEDPSLNIPWIVAKPGQHTEVPIDFNTGLILDAIFRRFPNNQVTIWDRDLIYSHGLGANSATLYAYRSHDNGTTIRVEWK